MKKAKRFAALLLSAVMLFQMSACSFTDAADKAKEVAGQAKEKAEQAKEKVVEWYDQIDFSQFQDGWNHAVDFASSTYSAAMGSEYVKNVGTAINNMKTDINKAYGSARSVAQEAGFVAEKWTAGTFNIDAIAGGSAYKANVVGSNDFASVDVSANYGENASLKYYREASGSAEAQATDFLTRYQEHCARTKNPMSMDEYFNKCCKDGMKVDDLYKSIYEGQSRIIPADQLNDAKDYLTGKINRLNTSGMNAAEATKYESTLKNLKDRLEAPDGTTSIPLNNDDCKAITELAQEGKIDLLDEKYAKLGITPAQIITPKYLLKRAVNAGMTGAVLNAVLTIGPDIFTILKEAAKTGSFDEDKLKEVGANGLLAGSEGFVEGSVSCAILTACQSGKLGSGLTGASPEVIGTLTVLAIDAIRYGYSLSKGEITTLDYSNLMSEEILTAVIAQGTGAALQALLPGIPFAYMVGCMAGGMLATSGLQTAKEIVMEIRDGGGFEAIVPKDAVETLRVIPEKIADLHIEEKVSGFKDTVISTANDGLIKIKAAIG